MRNGRSSTSTHVRVPVLGQVFAGKPVPAGTLPVIGRRETRLIKGAKPWNRFAAIRVNGESLIEDHIRDRDFLSIRPTHEARPGEHAIVLTPHGNTIKYVRPNDDGTAMLRGANALYEDQVWEVQDIKAQGVVKRVERDL